METEQPLVRSFFMIFVRQTFEFVNVGMIKYSCRTKGDVIK